MSTVGGVISDDALLEPFEGELLEGCQEQNLVNLLITIRQYDQEIPTKHTVSTFGTSNLLDVIETGYCKLRVRHYVPNLR